MNDVLAYLVLGWMVIGLAVQFPTYFSVMFWLLKEDISSADPAVQAKVSQFRETAKESPMFVSLAGFFAILAIYIFEALLWPKEFINK